MKPKVSRRTLNTAAVAGALGGISAASVQAAQTGDERDYPAPKFQPQFKKPQLGRILVQDFVIFGHSDLEMVKLLLEKHPAVLNATMDWGGGDWESALGGAAHMGRRDIAEFLLSKGARIDIFAAVMLGDLDTVKSTLTRHPTLVNAKGPHGIPLIAHAKAGGKEAAPVLVYLEGLAVKA